MVFITKLSKFRQSLYHTYLRFHFYMTRMKEQGAGYVLKHLSYKFSILFLGLLFLPISLILACFGYRRVMFFNNRIGHLAIEPDILLKAQSLGLIEKKKWFVLAPKNLVANSHLLFYWQPFFSIYQSEFACFFLQCLSIWPFMRYDVSHFINQDNSAQLSYKVYQMWGNQSPLLHLTNEDKAWGETQLKQLGLPSSAWFVGLHVREGGYSPIDESVHSHRNGNLEYLIPAIEEITKRGGWVIRLGDPSMMPLKPMPQVIDYAHHPLRSARLDIYLCARSRFILGNTAGIFLVASIFGVPSALANMIPMPTLGLLPTDLSIPKLFYLPHEKRYHTFPEVMQSPLSTYRYAPLYQKTNVEIVENSPEDILLMTQEMLDRLEGKFVETEADAILHQRYMSLFQPHHYSYGACSKVSFKFLRKYQDLIEGQH